ncbi:HAD-IB family hydrolase [Nanchangia anserum]|uniref:HAD family hydrolase n=1 Tax=Nanchangia anserum TaxID=2692125 RepID=UPI00188350ED|nr:HAD-IB family hydrolase [Nanchangia anserum]QOX81546.1 HAD-IB family hydrolase [Nanchangia anserum]
MPPGRFAAFFDIDQTLVRGASSYHLARELYRRGFFTPADLAFAFRESVLYLVRGEDPRRIRRVVERAIQAMAGHSVAEVMAIGVDFARDLYDERLFAGTTHILKQHQALGHEVWLLSTSPQEVTDLLAAHLGATGSLGTQLAREDGYYRAELSTPVMHGQVKADAACALARQRGLDLSRSWAYSDSKSDLPLLSAVGHPCAVNPDSALRAHARANDWPIADFRGTLRLVHTPKARRSAYLAGGLWAATAILRHLRR